MTRTESEIGPNQDLEIDNWRNTKCYIYPIYEKMNETTHRKTLLQYNQEFSNYNNTTMHLNAQEEESRNKIIQLKIRQVGSNFNETQREKIIYKDSFIQSKIRKSYDLSSRSKSIPKGQFSYLSNKSSNPYQPLKQSKDRLSLPKQNLILNHRRLDSCRRNSQNPST